MQHIYKSDTLTHAAGSRRAFSLAGVPRRNNRGGRLVVEEIWIQATLNLTTDGSTTVDGRDMCGFVKSVEIKDVAGYRRRLTGALAKLHAQMELGDRTPDDPSDLAVSQTNQPRTCWIPIVFASDRNKRSFDFAMPVDDFQDGGEFAIEMPSASDINKTAGSTLTIVSGSYTAYFVCRDEFDIELKGRDEVNWVDQDAAANVKVLVQGAMVRALFLHKDAANGGTSVTTVTDATFDQISGYSALPRDLLKQAYLGQQAYKTSDDLVYNDLALPLIWPQRGAKILDYPIIGQTLQGRMTTTMAAGRLMYHLIQPKSQAVIANTLLVNDPAPGQKPQIKTEDKGSSRETDAMGLVGAYLPWVVKPRRG